MFFKRFPPKPFRWGGAYFLQLFLSFWMLPLGSLGCQRHVHWGGFFLLPTSNPLLPCYWWSLRRHDDDDGLHPGWGTPVLGWSCGQPSFPHAFFFIFHWNSAQVNCSGQSLGQTTSFHNLSRLKKEWSHTLTSSSSPVGPWRTPQVSTICVCLLTCGRPHFLWFCYCCLFALLNSINLLPRT